MELLSVRSWDHLDPDEYIRLCPQLAASGQPVHECVVRHLATCVAVRTWRLRHLGERRDGVTLKSMTLSKALSLGERQQALMFGPPGWIEIAVAHWRHADTISQAEIEAVADLLFLDDVLQRAQDGSTRNAGPAQTAMFAYLTGLHPAYLWQSARLTLERDTAAAWLGVIARGRPALMPPEVADYFWDVIEVRAGRPVLRDGGMARFVRGSADLEQIRMAADRRRQGRSMVVRRSIKLLNRGSEAPKTSARPSWDDTESVNVSHR